MSLILDALRKIELERKAKRLDQRELRRDVLHYHGAVPTADKSRRIPLVAAVLLLFAAAALFLYFTYMPPAPHTVIRQQPAVVREPATQTPSQPRLAAPAPEPVQKSTQPAVKSAMPLVTESAATDSVSQKGRENGISVTGIAWQDERALRRAVINGHLVGEGDEIAGAKVLEIKENRVRFNRNGEIFEIMHASRIEKP